MCNLALYFLPSGNGYSMLLASWNHAPFSLRNFVNNGNPCLLITTVIDARQGRVYLDLSKTVVHCYYLSLIIFPRSLSF